MDSYIKLTETNEPLPIKIKVVNGNNSFYIKKLADNNKANLIETIFEIREHLGIEIYLESEAAIEVRWGKVSDFDNDIGYYSYKLNDSNRKAIIFKTLPDSSYEWPLGLYNFEILFDNKVYFGLFKVNPLNLSEENVKELHEFLYERLKTLVMNHLKYKKVSPMMASDMEKNHKLIWDLYKQKEYLLFASLNYLERNSQNILNKKYVLENIPKKIDNKSVRWTQTFKGISSNNIRYLNSRMEIDVNSSANRTVKHFILKIIEQLNRVLIFIRNIISELEVNIGNLQKENEYFLEKYEKPMQYVKVSKSSKSKIKKKAERFTVELKHYESQLIFYRDWFNSVNSAKNKLLGVVNNNFWLNISNVPPYQAVIGNNNGYKNIFKIYKEFNRKKIISNGESTDAIVLRPTYELYEYFVFLIIEELFINNGFRHYSPDKLNLELNSLINGIEDGTTIELIKDNLLLKIVFNGEIEMHEQIAFEKQTYFFTKRQNRKPDIRIDKYIITSRDAFNYKESIIIDAKYKPIRNIYSDTYDTHDMEQLDNYLGIKRINEIDGEKVKENPYIQNPIKTVLCVYAGEGNKRPKQTFFGTLLRVFPTKDNIEGIDDLEKILILDWINGN